MFIQLVIYTISSTLSSLKLLSVCSVDTIAALSDSACDCVSGTPCAAAVHCDARSPKKTRIEFGSYFLH